MTSQKVLQTDFEYNFSIQTEIQNLDILFIFISSVLTAHQLTILLKPFFTIHNRQRNIFSTKANYIQENYKYTKRMTKKKCKILL